MRRVTSAQGVSNGTSGSREYPIADDSTGHRENRRLHGALARSDRLHRQERKRRPLSGPRQTVANRAARGVEKSRARQHAASLPALLYHLRRPAATVSAPDRQKVAGRKAQR